MTYKVLKDFTDANESSKEHVYHVGDTYPYAQYVGSTTKARIAELTNPKGPNSSFNGPVIEEIAEEKMVVGEPTVDNVTEKEIPNETVEE